MEIKNNLTELLSEAEKLSQIEKCRTCQCFYDMLLDFREALKKEESVEEIATRLENIISESEVTHNCLGCDPCYPVPLSNLLFEATRTPTGNCGPVCKPVPVKIMRLTPSWPVEQGEYIIGRKSSPVAICTLGSDDLAEALTAKLGKERFAIMGKTHTENIGIEKIVKNAITNPDIRFIVLCGKDTRGHLAGQSLACLSSHGVNHEKKIIDAKGQRPVLKNLEFSEIEYFRAQVEIIDMITTEDLLKIQEKVISCEQRSPGRFDRTLTLKKIEKIQAQPPKRLVLDPSGFFIIYPKKEEGKIYLEHYTKDGTLNQIIFGEDPILIASTAIQRNLISRLDHAAYLGRELEKAYLSMRYGFQYIQDSAPGK
jgi:tetrahydromethanopterin S-methyltransferase subunit A